MNSQLHYVLGWDVIARIATMYGYDFVRGLRVESGYRNSSYSFEDSEGRALNFILYKREPGSVQRIRRTNELGNVLMRHGVPARTAINQKIIKVGRRYGSLYEYLPGETIPWEAYTMKHIKLLGHVMATIHGAPIGSVSLPRAIDEYSPIIKRMTDYFHREDVKAAMRKKLHLSVDRHALERCKNTLKQTGSHNALLHLDLVRGNVLFRSATMDDVFVIGKTALCGVLDLEKAAVGPIEYDIARTLAFLQVDCPKDADKIYKYFLMSGYEKRGGGRRPSHLFVEQLIVLFLIYDLYKFLRDNPYESLEANHHYTRTIKILGSRKAIYA